MTMTTKKLSDDDQLNLNPVEIEINKIVDECKDTFLSNNDVSSTIPFCISKDPVDWIIDNATVIILLYMDLIKIKIQNF